MTNQEFSDTFTTLLNSYNTQAQFGEQASKREIVLDEYEKSVLLTQAQDIIVKSYFDGTLNAQGQGFDDSTRRQVDFSSLIKVAELQKVTFTLNNPSTAFDERGIIYEMPHEGTGTDEDPVVTKVLFILNERLLQKTVATVSGSGSSTKIASYDETKTRGFVVVPISYKEYDREMSKPYAQPLKKQAWRLFQNKDDFFNVYTELIPKFNVKESQVTGTMSHPAVGDVVFIYRIRYVERPAPIILEDLPDGLVIDGQTEESSCTLNPILHMDILNKAVELAIATRGGSIPQPQQATRA